MDFYKNIFRKKLNFAIFIIFILVFSGNIIIWLLGKSGVTYYYSRVIYGNALSESLVLADGYYIVKQHEHYPAISSRWTEVNYVVDIKSSFNVLKALEKGVLVALAHQENCSLYKVDYGTGGFIVHVVNTDIRINLESESEVDGWKKLCTAVYLD